MHKQLLYQATSKLIAAFTIVMLVLTTMPIKPAQAITLTETFSNDGTFAWTAPAEVTSVTVQVWGGGGKGGTRTSNGGGGGGGGGAYSIKTGIPVVPGNNYTVVVGAGATTTSAGGDSYFINTTTVLAKGGGSVNNNTTAGASGGLASAGVGDTRYDGGDGANAPGTGGGGGSSAGTSAAGTNATTSTGAVAPAGGGNGGNGRTGSQGDGTVGATPGGGGGGAYRTSFGTRNGGNGADGQVIITYTLPDSTTAGIATAVAAGSASIDVSMPYTGDGNNDNTYTVDYKLSSSGSWTNWVTGSAHSASPYTTTITGLAPSTSYDVRVTYNDADGVTGANPQTITNITTLAPSVTLLDNGGSSWGNHSEGGGGITSHNYTAPAGDNRVVVVVISDEGPGVINTVTVGGQTAILIDDAIQGASHISTYYRVIGSSASPTPANIAVTWTTPPGTDSAINAATYANVNQAAGVGANNTINSVGTGTSGTGSITTTSVSNQASGRVIYAYNANGGTGNGQIATPTSTAWTFTETWDVYVTSNSTSAGHSNTAAGTATVSTTGLAGSNRSTMVVFALNPAPNKMDQTITFGALADKTYGDPDFTVSATASSGLPVSFIASGDCTVAGDSVHITGAGSCTITAQQAGNATYNPAPDVPQSFTIGKATPIVNWSNPLDITYGTALSGTQLNATASVPGSFAYTPVAGTILNAGNGQTLSVNFTPTDTANYNSVPGTTVTINVLKATPTITWNDPADITYGTALSATQLNATASVPGSFVYTPDAGEVLNAGTHSLHADFTPTDTANYTNTSKDVSITVNKATPVVTWSTPADITYGTALSAAQLNATASVAGAFDYSPAAGTVLNAGVGQTLSVDFTPTDALNYNSVPGTTVTIDVLKATPTIFWSDPADITYGTALSGTQLNASASVPGSFTYTPATGTVLDAGSGQTLSADFTPTDVTNYNSVPGTTVTIDVLKATPSVNWDSPADIVYGTALGATQLNATASVPGSFLYTPASGTVLNAGNGQTLSVDFIPADTVNYNNVSGTTVTINVLKATPTISWGDPTDITYGTALSATQLNATASVPGSFAYNPPAGTILNAGAGQTLSVDFTPTDSANYNSVLDTTVTLNVLKATPSVNWSDPADISYGTPLGATQLNASASVPGSFVYTPAAGTVLNAGAGQTLSVDFTPTDTTNYNSVPGTTVTINVFTATPIVTWANPAAIPYGTPLGATQLNATASVPGTFVYTPAGGTVLNAGAGQTLSVDFTPTDSANYNPVLGTTVSIDVLKATPTITWADPADITYGTALSAAQLNATASVPGSFAYNPPAGTVLNAGVGQILSVDFTPTDTANFTSVPGTTVTIDVLTNPATVTLSNLNYTYDGNPHGATAVTNPPGLSVDITYAGSPSAPTNANSYAVVATVNDPNYSGSANGTLVIARATVDPSIAANNKVYDGTTDSTLTCMLSGVIGSDTVNCTSGTATFDDENVGTGKTVTATGLSLSGASAGNYQLSTTTASDTANITRRTLTVTAAGMNKLYDGTTDATVTLSDDRVGGDSLTVTYANASFLDPNVGTGKTVNVNGISLSGGADAGNYDLGNTTATTTANITSASQTITISISAPATATNGSGFDVEASASSGLPVTITSTGSCTGGDTDGTATITMTSGFGTCTVHYNQAGDANYSAALEITEDVAATEGPAFTSADNTAITVGNLSVFTITTSGNPTPSISHESGALPSGIIFTDLGTGSATLSGTPAAGTAGVYTLEFKAANGILPDALQTFTLTVAGGPVVVTNGLNSVPDSGDGHIDELEILKAGINQIMVTFSTDVSDTGGGANVDDVTNPANYILVGDNGDGIQTYTCDTTLTDGGVTGGDNAITIDTVTYDNKAGVGPFVSTLNVNGGVPLSNGSYRLIVCGTTSIVSATNSLALAGAGGIEGTDFTRNFSVAIPSGGGGGSSANRALNGLIPVTGFAPGRFTDLSSLPVTRYDALSGVSLEIPALKLRLPVIGIPMQEKTWDVNWLLNQAGWLEGSAFPGYAGNSVLTSHVTLQYGQPGPFANLHKLEAGDKIFVRAFGTLYIYEVKSVEKLNPTNPTILQHEEKSWLTLFTCADYDEDVSTYSQRLVVKATLVGTQPDNHLPSGR